MSKYPTGQYYLILDVVRIIKPYNPSLADQLKAEAEDPGVRA